MALLLVMMLQRCYLRGKAQTKEKSSYGKPKQKEIAPRVHCSFAVVSRTFAAVTTIVVHSSTGR